MKFRRQQLMAGVIGWINFLSALCASLQSPFYPERALEKGATSTECGMVLGVFELVVFLVCPLIGKYLVELGVRRCLIWGTLLTGFCCVIFGLLDVIRDPTLFVTAGINIRIFMGLGNAAFMTASYSIIAQEFSNNVATMFSAIEMCFGLGLLIGPMVGAYLYVLGGFTLPFVTLGTSLLVSSFGAECILPSVDTHSHNTKIGVLQAISLLPILLACLSIFAASLSTGFLQVNLEPHLKEFHTTTLTIGFIFMLNGTSYAVCAPLFGWICDKKLSPKLIGLLGNILITLSMAVTGPVPLLPIPKNYDLVVGALACHGVGMSASLVSGFSDAYLEALANGFEDNIQTYGLVSGLWSSSLALGAFVGHTSGGYLRDEFGFEWSSILVMVFTSLSFISSLIYILSVYCSKRQDEEKLIIDQSHDYGSLELNCAEN